MDYLKILHSCFLMFSFHSLDRHNSKVRQPKQTGLNLFFSSQYSFTFYYIFPKDSKKQHSKNIDIISCYSSQDIPRIFSIFLVQRTRKDRKSTRLNSSHVRISYAVFCLKKKTTQ